MSTTVGWDDIALRMLLTTFAGALIGINRAEHGHSAGLRTHLLVCLAASISMIQVNILLATVGRHPDSFIMLDLMRLPLGILTGMGFIGGGAILRRGELVTGVTTAATLWFVTVMGLCFGGGQNSLGLAMLGIGLVVLSALKWAEDLMSQEHEAELVIAMRFDGPDEKQIREVLHSASFRIVSCGVTYLPASQLTRLRCELKWRRRPSDSQTPEFVQSLAHLPGVVRLQWRP